MTPIAAASQVELRKAVASRVLRSIGALTIAGIALLAGVLTSAAMAGNEQILAQLGPLAEKTGWDLLLGITAQITAAGALLGFGSALGWIFGREFTDGTINGLFALPVSRPTIAIAKHGAYLVWVAVLALVLTVAVLTTGLLLDLGAPSGDVVSGLIKQTVLTVLIALVAVPASWAATLGRGPLAGIAVTVVLLIVAQVLAIAAPSAATWIPLSVPALWALEPESVGAGQLSTVIVVPTLFATLTSLGWRRLQLDR